MNILYILKTKPICRVSATSAVIALVMAGMSLLGSCKKFVQVAPPKNQLVTTTVFNNNTAATSAQLAIYAQMFNSSPYVGYKIPLFTGLSSDELKNYSTFQEEIQFYTNSLSATSGGYSDIWTAAYKYIYEANAVIAGLTNSTGVDGPVKRQLIAEAKFTRAFWHFYLVNLFGDVPLVTSVDYNQNANLPRISKDQVYHQIIQDLSEAATTLSADYVGVDGVTATPERVRPNAWVAKALLSRVFLYTGDWVNAEVQASAVISNTGLYSLVNDPNGVFLKNSTETIWQLMPTNNSVINTYEGDYFILTGAPLTNSYNCVTLSPQLLNAFEVNDLRRSDWVGVSTDGTNNYYFPYKYKVQQNSTITEYSMVLRLAELYLIRAEAEANGAGSGASGAVDDLNKIRNRAGLGNYNGATDKASLLTAILHERQVELFSEWGHRWFDLKRSGDVDAVMAVVAPTKGGSWNTNKQFYPIPQTEINNDPNLKQNAGY